MIFKTQQIQNKFIVFWVLYVMYLVPEDGRYDRNM